MHACSLSPKSRPGAILPAWRASLSSLSSVATSHPPQQPWTLAVSRCGSGCWGRGCQVPTPDAACEGCAHRGHCGRWRCWGSRKQHPWAPMLASSWPTEQISSGTPWCLRRRPRSACGQRRVTCCVASDTWNLECTELFSLKHWGLSCVMPAFVATRCCGAGPFPRPKPLLQGDLGFQRVQWLRPSSCETDRTGCTRWATKCCTWASALVHRHPAGPGLQPGGAPGKSWLPRASWGLCVCVL